MGKLLSGAVVVPRVEGFHAPYATGEQHRKPLIIYSVHLHFPEFRRTSPLLSNRILNGAIFDGSKLNRGSSRNQNFRLCAMYDWLPFTHEQLLGPSGCYRNLSYASHMRWRMHAEQIRMKLPVANFVADIAQPRG